VAATWHAGPTPPPNAGNASFYELNVADTAAVDEVIRRVEEDMGEIDVLINNAGISLGSLLPMTSADDWQRVMGVNLMGVFNTCKGVSRRMMRRKHGRIINVVSLKGVLGAAGESAYAASKGGAIALTKSLAVELAAYNIAVLAVCPGYISSALNGFNRQLEKKEADLSLMDTANNLEDAVNFIAFLCGDALKSVTGQVFHIDSRIH